MTARMDVQMSEPLLEDHGEIRMEVCKDPKGKSEQG